MSLSNRRRTPEEKAAAKAAKTEKWAAYTAQNQPGAGGQVRAMEGMPPPIRAAAPPQSVTAVPGPPNVAQQPAAVAVQPAEGVQVLVENPDGSLSQTIQSAPPTAQVQAQGIQAQHPQLPPEGFQQHVTPGVPQQVAVQPGAMQPGMQVVTPQPVVQLQPVVQPQPAVQPQLPPNTGQPPQPVPPQQPPAGAAQPVGQSQMPVPPADVPQPRQAPGFVMVATQEEAPKHALDLTVVTSSFLRPHKTGPQMAGLARQTLLPARTIVVTGPHPASEEAIAGFPRVHVTHDMGPWFRFHIAATSGTPFVAVLDDDADPGPRWLEEAIDHLRKQPHDVVAAAGHRLQANGGMEFIGPPNARPEKDTPVDIGRSAWVCSREIVEDALRRHANPLAGWGETLSYIASKRGGNTVVLAYTRDAAGLLSPPATDTVGLSTRPDMGAARTEAFDTLRQDWTMLYEPSPQEPSPLASIAPPAAPEEAASEDTSEDTPDET